jgi:hypothetical protein
MERTDEDGILCVPWPRDAASKAVAGTVLRAMELKRWAEAPELLEGVKGFDEWTFG